MKRRTLFGGAISGAFAFLDAPLRGASSTATPTPKKLNVAAYDAIKIVYDKFESFGASSEEVCFTDSTCLTHDTQTSCKKIAITKDGLCEIWLLMCESSVSIPNYFRENRELKLVEIRTKKFCDLNTSIEYNAKKALRGYSFAVGAIASVSQTGNVCTRRPIVTLQTGPVFTSNATNECLSETRVSILSRFLALIA